MQKKHFIENNCYIFVSCIIIHTAFLGTGVNPTFKLENLRFDLGENTELSEFESEFSERKQDEIELYKLPNKCYLLACLI